MVYFNAVKEKAKTHEYMIDGNLRFGNPIFSEIMVKAGVDQVCIDNEHFPFTDEQIVNIVRAVHGAGGTCIIRIGSKSREAIYRVMDMGVDGMLFPNVETAEEARMLVDATKYPSVGGTGNRGCCPITRGADYGVNLDVQEYYKRINEVTTVTIMIESKKGYENIDEIVKVEGLDGIVIGPSDFSGSFGKPGQLSDPEVKHAFDTVRRKIAEAGFPQGGLTYTAEAVKKALEEGKTTFGINSDLQMITKEFGDHIRGAKERIAAFGYKDTGKTVKQKLRDREPLITPFVRIAEPAMGEIATMCGADFIKIDDEHFPFSDAEMINMIRAIHARGGKVVVRPHDKSKAAIGRLMDMGADGVYSPQVKDAEEAKALIDAVKYAPIGSRGLCPITPGANYGYGQTSVSEYARKANEESIVGIMIETKSAVEDLDNILKLKDQLDFITIGPSDLSASYGIPGQYDNPMLKRIMKEVRDKVIAAGITFIGDCYNDDAVTECLKNGETALNIGSDVQYLLWGFNRDVQAIKKLIAEREGRK